MNNRSSNMELLRIIAMLMIISYHIFYHCINIQLTDPQFIAILKNDWYCHPWFSKKLCALAIISPMGQAGNAIFIIISGYFMAHKKLIDLTKISKKLLSQLGFATVVLVFLSIYAYKNITAIPLKLISFNSFNELSWFIGYYFIVIVIAKIFLNSFLSKLDHKNYLMFIVVLFSLVQFSWSTIIISNLGEGLEIICIGIFLYSLGGYIRKYNPFENIRFWVIIAIILALNFISITNFYITTADNILSYDLTSGNIFIQCIPTYTNNQFLPVVLGISIFELFRRIKPSNSAIINYIGASTFMVYLVHDNEFVYKLMRLQDWITLLYKNMILFLYSYVMWILKIFTFGVICYYIFVLCKKFLNYCKPLILKRQKTIL